MKKMTLDDFATELKRLIATRDLYRAEALLLRAALQKIVASKKDRAELRDIARLALAAAPFTEKTS